MLVNVLTDSQLEFNVIEEQIHEILLLFVAFENVDELQVLFNGQQVQVEQQSHICLIHQEVTHHQVDHLVDHMHEFGIDLWVTQLDGADQEDLADEFELVEPSIQCNEIQEAVFHEQLVVEHLQLVAGVQAVKLHELDVEVEDDVVDLMQSVDLELDELANVLELRVELAVYGPQVDPECVLNILQNRSVQLHVELVAERIDELVELVLLESQLFPQKVHEAFAVRHLDLLAQTWQQRLVHLCILQNVDWLVELHEVLDLSE